MTGGRVVPDRTNFSDRVFFVLQVADILSFAAARQYLEVCAGVQWDRTWESERL